jgi:hypothetical protein
MLSAGSYTGYALTLYDKLAFPGAFTGFIDDGKITLIALDAGGTIGTTGPQGFTGINGVTGAFGGPAGATGIQGTQGMTGFQGFTGTQGITGLIGNTGMQGTQGFTGFIGYTGAISVFMDGGMGSLFTGIKADVYIPFNINLYRWTLLLGETGTMRLQLDKGTYATYPPSTMIHGGLTGPICINAIKAQELTTGWTGINLLAGDIVRTTILANNASSVSRGTLVLEYIK